MLLSKTLALVATTITTASAYSHAPLETRNDLDFTPDDLEHLFGRDLFEDDLDDFELFGRDAEMSDEEFDFLFERDLFDLDLAVRDLDFDTEDTLSNVKRSPGCLDCGGGRSKAPKKQPVMTHQRTPSSESEAPGLAKKLGSSSKKLLSKTGSVIKEGFTGPGAHHLGAVPFIDPVGAMMGVHTHGPLGAHGENADLYAGSRSPFG